MSKPDTLQEEMRRWTLKRLEELVAAAKASAGEERVAKILEARQVIRDHYADLELAGRHKAVLAEYHQLLLNTPPPRPPGARLSDWEKA